MLAVTFTFFAQGWIGGGDAKLAAATALWLGFDHLLPYVLYASIFGGILTLAMIQLQADAVACSARRAGMGASACTSSTAACPTASRSRPRRC